MFYLECYKYRLRFLMNYIFLEFSMSRFQIVVDCEMVKIKTTKEGFILRAQTPKDINSTCAYEAQGHPDMYTHPDSQHTYI